MLNTSLNCFFYYVFRCENSLTGRLNLTPVRERSRGKDTGVETVSHPYFPRDPEVLMRLWAHVSKEAGDGEDELHNVISLLSARDNTVLQSSLDTAGLLELANENLPWSPWPAPSTCTHTQMQSSSHSLQMACWTLQGGKSYCRDLQCLILKCERVPKTQEESLPRALWVRGVK